MLNVANPAAPDARRTPSPVRTGRTSAIADDLATLALDDHGLVLECDPTCERRYGYRRDELEGRHISILFPELRDFELVVEERINSRLAFLCQSGIPFQARRRDGGKMSSQLFINRLDRHRVVILARSLDRHDTLESRATDRR